MKLKIESVRQTQVVDRQVLVTFEVLDLNTGYVYYPTVSMLNTKHTVEQQIIGYVIMKTQDIINARVAEKFAECYVGAEIDI